MLSMAISVLIRAMCFPCAREEVDVEKMKTVWRFRELEEEEEEDVNDVENRKKKNVSTVVDFEIAFKVKSSAHAAALSVFFEDVANTQIQAFEKRCRSLMSLPSAE